MCARGDDKWHSGASDTVPNATGQCCVRTFSLEREASMPGSLPHLPREAPFPASDGLDRVLQSGQTPSRDPAADSGPTDTFCSFTRSAFQRNRSSHVRWVAPRLSERSINRREHIEQCSMKPLRPKRVVASRLSTVLRYSPVFVP